MNQCVRYLACIHNIQLYISLPDLTLLGSPYEFGVLVTFFDRKHIHRTTFNNVLAPKKNSHMPAVTQRYDNVNSWWICRLFITF